MKANKASDWFRRWGLWLLVALAVLLVILAAVLPSNGKKPKLLQEAKEGAERFKEKAEEEHAALKKKMDERRDELAEIEKIEDEEERLSRLAEFANRR